MCVCVYVCSHGATLVLVCVRVFEAESLLGAIFLQVGELFTVDGSTALPRQTMLEVSSVTVEKLLFFLCTLTGKNY